MSKAYQAGKLKYKKIADQEGDHLGKDYYIDGQNTQLIFFEKKINWGRENGLPN